MSNLMNEITYIFQMIYNSASSLFDFFKTDFNLVANDMLGLNMEPAGYSVLTFAVGGGLIITICMKMVKTFLPF